MEPSKFKILISVENFDEKTVENYRNCYVAEKRMGSKLSKIYRYQILIRQIKDLNEGSVKILRLYFILSVK